MDDGRDQQGPAAAPEEMGQRGTQPTLKVDGTVRTASPAAGAREAGLPTRTHPVPTAVFAEASPAAPSKVLSKASTDATLTVVSPSRAWSTHTPRLEGSPTKASGKSIWGPTGPASHQMQPHSAGSEPMPAHPSWYGLSHGEPLPPHTMGRADWAAAQHGRPYGWPTPSNPSWGPRYSGWGPMPSQGPPGLSGQSASWGVAPPSHVQVRGQPGVQPVRLQAQPWWQQEGWQAQQAGGGWQQPLPPPPQQQQQTTWGWPSAQQGWHPQQLGDTDQACLPAGGGASNDPPEHLVQLLASLQSSRQFAELAEQCRRLGQAQGQEPAATAGAAGTAGFQQDPAATTGAAAAAAAGPQQVGGSAAAWPLLPAQRAAEAQVVGEGAAEVPAPSQGTGNAAAAPAAAPAAREPPSGLSRECQELWDRYGWMDPGQEALLAQQAQQAAAPSCNPKPSPFQSFAVPGLLPSGTAGAVGDSAAPELNPAGDSLICVPTLPLSEHLTRSNSGSGYSLRPGECDADSCAATLAGAGGTRGEARAAAKPAALTGQQPALPEAAAAEQSLPRPQEQQGGSAGEGRPSCPPLQQGASLPAARPEQPAAAAAPASQRARAPAQVSTQQLHSIGAPPQPAQPRLQAGGEAGQHPVGRPPYAAHAMPAVMEVPRLPQQQMQAATPSQKPARQAPGSSGAALAGYQHHRQQQQQQAQQQQQQAQQAACCVPFGPVPPQSAEEPHPTAAQPQQQPPAQLPPPRHASGSLGSGAGSLPQRVSLQRQPSSLQQQAPSLQRRASSGLQRQPSQLEMLRIILEVEDHLRGVDWAQHAEREADLGQHAKRAPPEDERRWWEEQVATLLELQQEKDPAVRQLAMAILDILLAVYQETGEAARTQVRDSQGLPAAPKPQAEGMLPVARKPGSGPQLKNERPLVSGAPLRNDGLGPRRVRATQPALAAGPAAVEAAPSAMEVDGGAGGGAVAAWAGAGGAGSAETGGTGEKEGGWVLQREQSDDQIAAEALVAIFSSPVPSRGGSCADDRTAAGARRRERRNESLRKLAQVAVPEEAPGAPPLRWEVPRRKRSHWQSTQAGTAPASKRPRHERARQDATPGWVFNHILSAYVPQAQRSAAGVPQAARSRRSPPPLPPGVPLPPPHGSFALKPSQGSLPVPRWRQQAAQPGPAALRSKGYSSLWYGPPQPQPSSAAPSLQQQQWAWWGQSTPYVGYAPPAQQGGSGSGGEVPPGYPQQQPHPLPQAPVQPLAAVEQAGPVSPLGPPASGSPWLSSSAVQHLLGTAVSYIQLLQEQQATRLAAKQAQQQQQRPAAAAAPQAPPAGGNAGPWPAGQWGPPHAQQQQQEEEEEAPAFAGYGQPQNPAPAGLPGPRHSVGGGTAVAPPGGGAWGPAAAAAQQAAEPQQAEQAGRGSDAQAVAAAEQQGELPPGAVQRAQQAQQAKQEALALLSTLNPVIAKYFR